jgi:hypothetical protein
MIPFHQYVDLEYEGGGIGEYQYYDRHNQAWDTTTCSYTGTSRCAKMDCHLPSTHFSLLGFFKHRSIEDWFGQLFKHEGMCIWTDSEYSFMKNAKGSWPKGCILTGTTTSSGDSIYYAIKPVSGGGITFGLYTDTRCVKEYQTSGKDDPITPENVLGNILVDGGSGDHSNDRNKNNGGDAAYDTFDESLSAWDDAFDIFKLCQPCVAHDLYNYGYSGNGMYGSSYGQYSYGNDDGYNGKGDDYDCYDDAGYTNVNQCMKFMAKTSMYTAYVTTAFVLPRCGCL